MEQLQNGGGHFGGFGGFVGHTSTSAYEKMPHHESALESVTCGVVLVSAVSSRQQTAVQNYQSPPSDKKSVAFNFQERKNRRNIVPRSPNHSTDGTH